MNSDVICERSGSLGQIILNRPKALNALSLGMIDNIHRALNQWEYDDSVQALLFHSSDNKSYCAGGDIRWLFETGKNKDERQLQFFRDEYRLNYRIAQYPKPIIVLLSGLTMGGGIGISLHARIPVATHTTSFAMPETAIGFFPDIGASYFLSRCPDASGMYLALSGKRFSAYEAQFLDLLTYVIDMQSLDSLRQDLINLSLENANHTLLENCVASYVSPAQSASDLEQNLPKIQTFFSTDNFDDLIRKLETSDDLWAQKTLEELRRKSPLSLKVTFEQMKKARTMTLSECLEMDYILAQNFMHTHDFYEGVRAMVIDKDKNPQWCPSDLNEVSPEFVDSFFDAKTALLNVHSQPELMAED